MTPQAQPQRMAIRKFKVLIVDDSAAVRQTMAEIIARDPDLEVMGTAPDPYVAAERIRDAIPDVILLDIEMPKMDGLTFLRKIMSQRPIPVVICSTLTESGSPAFLNALEAGAVDVVTKPRVDTAHALQMSSMLICDTLKAAAQAKLSRRKVAVKPMVVEAKLTADAVLPSGAARRPIALGKASQSVVCIGASTGGTEALLAVLQQLPPDSPGIVIVQHMPEKFTEAFARRLDSLCAIDIKEASDHDAVLPGTALIAPGNMHMLLERGHSGYRVGIKDGPPVCRHRPSVDVLFRSASQTAGPNALGILLTGMGDDGARGLLEMRNAGSVTVAQDEESCVVFGMPKEAIQRGAAQKVMSLQRVPREIQDWWAQAKARTGIA